VRRSVQIKARIVADDEREEARHGRALLNLLTSGVPAK